MVDSVNTNASSLTALRGLNQTRAGLARSTNEATTGLSVSSSRDNAATFAIAQNVRSDNAGLSSVINSVNRASSVTDVALAAGGAVSDSLIRLRELAVQASDAGLDQSSRDAINQEFQVQLQQIGSTVSNASFNGTNVLDGSGASVNAIANEDGTETISVDGQDFNPGGGTVTLAPNASLSSAADAQALVAQIDQSLANVNSGLTELGAGATRLEEAGQLAQLRSDVNEVGIGNLVDANLAETAADLEAGQVQEQLGVLALNIANSQPQSLLQLFDDE